MKNTIVGSKEVDKCINCQDYDICTLSKTDLRYNCDWFRPVYYHTVIPNSYHYNK